MSDGFIATKLRCTSRHRRPYAFRAAVITVLCAFGLASAPAAWGAFASVASGSLTASTLSLAAPGTVSATFTCPTGSNKVGSVTVSSFAAVTRATSYVLTLTTPNATTTQTVPAPQQVTLSVAGFPNKVGSVTVSSFAAVTRATSYVLTLTTPNATTTQTVPAPQQVTLSVAGFPNKGLYTLTIVARVASWTGSPYTQTSTC